MRCYGEEWNGQEMRGKGVGIDVRSCAMHGQRQSDTMRSYGEEQTCKGKAMRGYGKAEQGTEMATNHNKTH